MHCEKGKPGICGAEHLFGVFGRATSHEPSQHRSWQARPKIVMQQFLVDDEWKNDARGGVTHGLSSLEGVVQIILGVACMRDSQLCRTSKKMPTLELHCTQRGLQKATSDSRLHDCGKFACSYASSSVFWLPLVQENDLHLLKGRIITHRTSKFREMGPSVLHLSNTVSVSRTPHDGGSRVQENPFAQPAAKAAKPNDRSTREIQIVRRLGNTSLKCLLVSFGFRLHVCGRKGVPRPILRRRGCQVRTAMVSSLPVPERTASLASLLTHNCTVPVLPVSYRRCSPW